MATEITRISAQFSMGATTAKTDISLESGKNGISMTTTQSMTRECSSPFYYRVQALRAREPNSAYVSAFIKDVFKDYSFASVKVYWYVFTHAATLAYAVMLGGLLFHLSIPMTLALSLPPVLIYYVVKARLTPSSQAPPTDLRDPSFYYNQRKRALFVAVQEDPSEPSTVNNNNYLAAENLATRHHILGTVAIDLEGAGDTAVFRHLCVQSEYRRCGVGQELVANALQFCEMERFSRVVVKTSNLQGPASRLLVKSGFKKVNSRTDLTVLPGVELWSDTYVKCLRSRHTSSCCR